MTKLSIIVPIHNGVDFLPHTLNNLVLSCYYPIELILVDDFSDKPTKDFIETVSIDRPHKLIKLANAQHSWTNFSWNKGVEVASSPYIAVINSDVFTPPNWDFDLIGSLRKGTISCPYERTSHNGPSYKLLDVHSKHFPHMIKGSCFMFRADDKDKLFPIPPQIKHWCGDNVIADRARELNGTYFNPNVIITHLVSQSARTIPQAKYNERIKEDLKQYGILSGRNLDFISDSI